MDTLPLCHACRKNRGMPQFNWRCEDCWADAAEYWFWRGLQSLEIRTAKRLQREDDDMENW